MFKELFSPLEIGPIRIKNRIQVTPHELQYFENGLPTETTIFYYEERAKGGVALLELSQLMVKEPTGLVLPDWEYDSNRRFPLVNRQEIVPWLKKLSEAIHKYGAKIFMEVSAFNWLYGPVSSIPFENGVQLRELTIADIREIQDAFGIASKYVRDGNFDGIDLHGTHGAIIEQFYSPALNRRTDQYGGTVEKRMKFLFETIEVVKNVVGDSMALGMRLCADERIEGGVTPDYAAKMARFLDGRLDFLNVDSGSVTNFEALNQRALQTQPLYIEPGYGVHMADAVKRATEKTKVGTVGRINDPVLAEYVLERKQADYVGMTRALIADPELPKKAQEGRLDEIRPCIGTLQDCWGRSVSHEWPMRCTVNPAVGRERERGEGTLQPAAVKKKILIIGAGVAGLEAARVASLRGHDVVMYERNSKIGGQVNLAKLIPGRSDIEAIVRWYEGQLRKYGIRVKLNMDVSAKRELVEYLTKEEKPDVVILATGSNPIRTGTQMITFSEVPGWDRPNVYTIDEVISRSGNLHGRVVVADSTNYIIGTGVSEYLATRGSDVTLVSPHSSVTSELFNYNQSVYAVRRLFAVGVKVVTHSWIRRIEEKGTIVFHIPTGTEQLIEADHVILNTGRKQNCLLNSVFRNFVKEVYEIGDCNVAGALIRDALEAGYEAGCSI